MTMTPGRYLRHEEARGFTYEYTCPACGRTFRDIAPELSAPALCHGCYTGGKRGAAHVMPSGRRVVKRRRKDGG